jgi:fructose-1,6-bisphosphatase I
MIPATCIKTRDVAIPHSLISSMTTITNPDSLIDTNLLTLSRHVVHEQSKYKGATGDLTMLLVSLQVACKFVSAHVRRAGLANLTGLAAGGSKEGQASGNMINVQGEAVKKLDVLANDVFINALQSTGKVRVMVSEENENEIIVHSVESHSAKYCLVFDPLDGSSNIDAGVSIGSIFGIYKAESGTVQDVLRPGKEMVGAGFAMYGSFTSLVLSTGHGVHGYTLDPTIGEFILTQANVLIPKRGKIYSVNEGNSRHWHEGCRRYFEDLKNPTVPGRSPYSARYVGSMVSDVYRTLLYGGIFAYPGDKKSPHGKLRVLYECFPMAFIIEQAGGRATTGSMRILDIVPASIHQRSSIILGSEEDVLDYESYCKRYSD